jgi:hypothetical protein
MSFLSDYFVSGGDSGQNNARCTSIYLPDEETQTETTSVSINDCFNNFPNDMITKVGRYRHPF